jgi:hypothetical protein
MLRNVISVIIGLVASFAIIIIMEKLGDNIYPMPANFDIKNQDAIKTFITNAPAILHLMILFAYALSSFVGGLIASMVAVDKKITKAITVGGILMGLGMYSLISLHPGWVVFAGVFAFLPFAYFGGKLGLRFSVKKYKN